MAVYLIFQIEITDPERYREYVARAPATIAAWGGEYLVRGGEFEVLEGDWPQVRNVVVRFPDRAAAMGWYESDAYREVRAIRHQAARSNGILVEGT